MACGGGAFVWTYVRMYACIRMHACMCVCNVCDVCDVCNVCNVCDVCDVCDVCNACNACNVYNACNGMVWYGMVWYGMVWYGMCERTYECMYVCMCACVAGSQKCCKDLANTRLDLRNAANSLQIEGKGVLPGDPSVGGWEHGTRDHIYI